MNAELIFDLGLHKGEDSEFYLKKGFKVVAVDALAENCDISAARLHEFIDKGNLVIVNKAVAEKDDEKITFYKNLKISVLGTVHPDIVKRNNGFGTTSVPIEVDTVRLDSLIRRFGMPYYLKMDLEGSDLLAVRQLKALGAVPKFLSMESDKISWKKLVEECTTLRDLGYTKFKVVNQQWVTGQQCPTSPVEGNYISHRFELGSSGLFGRELPGDWITYEECLRKYKKIFLRYRLFGDNGWLNNRYAKWIFRRLRVKYPDVEWYDTHATF